MSARHEESPQASINASLRALIGYLKLSRGKCHSTPLFSVYQSISSGYSKLGLCNS